MPDMVVCWEVDGEDPCDECIAAEGYYNADELPISHENCLCQVYEIDEIDLIEGFTVEWDNIEGYDNPTTYKVCVEEEEVDNCEGRDDEERTYYLSDYEDDDISFDYDSFEDTALDLVVTEVDEDEVTVGVPYGNTGTIRVDTLRAGYTISADALVTIDGDEYNAGTYYGYVERSYSILAEVDLSGC